MSVSVLKVSATVQVRHGKAMICSTVVSLHGHLVNKLCCPQSSIRSGCAGENLTRTTLACEGGCFDMATKSKADEYSARAIECERKADQTRDEDVAKGFRTTAAMWREMADMAERQSW